MSGLFVRGFSDCKLSISVFLLGLQQVRFLIWPLLRQYGFGYIYRLIDIFDRFSERVVFLGDDELVKCPPT